MSHTPLFQWQVHNFSGVHSNFGWMPFLVPQKSNTGLLNESPLFYPISHSWSLIHPSHILSYIIYYICNKIIINYLLQLIKCSSCGQLDKTMDFHMTDPGLIPAVTHISTLLRFDQYSRKKSYKMPLINAYISNESIKNHGFVSRHVLRGEYIHKFVILIVDS